MMKRQAEAPSGEIIVVSAICLHCSAQRPACSSICSSLRQRQLHSLHRGEGLQLHMEHNHLSRASVLYMLKNCRCNASTKLLA